MNIKKLKVPRKMRLVKSITSTKFKGMKVSKSIKSIKKINIKKRLPSLKKGKTGGGGGGGGGGGVSGGTPRMGFRRSSNKWISDVRKKMLRPKLLGHKKSNNKNIIIIHNNTSITGNEEDNRTSCATVKEVTTFKEEDVTSIDSAAPPPHDQASKEEETTTEEEQEDEEEEVSQGDTEIREEMAALLIQSVFRGHLARRAFGALRSLVKLQAVVRGVCVRRQARIALHCMNTMVRLQVRIRARQFLNRPSDAVEA